MRLAKIKNGYLFNKDPNGVHTYAVYYDRSSKSYRAIQLTHLYKWDPKRKRQFKKGQLMKTKFNCFELPSGVWNNYYDKNYAGGKINLNDKSNVTIITKHHLPKKQSQIIKAFAKKVHK